MLWLAFAAAQATPAVTLVTPEVTHPGDPVRLEAVGLRDLPHDLTVITPSGESLRSTALPVTGRISLPIATPEVGGYRITFSGPDVAAEFNLQVRPLAAEPSAAPPAAGEPRATGGRQPDLVLEENTLSVYESSGLLRWRWSSPAASGESSLALYHLGRVWLAHGHQLLLFDAELGKVLDRVATSGIITDLQPTEAGMLVTSRVRAPGSDLHVEARYELGALLPPALFDPFEPTLFSALEREAALPDPLDRLERDATNPFLHLHISLHALTELERDAAMAAALAALTTFYDAARLARAFADQGWWEAAEAAMTFAHSDFLARGYHPGLLTDPEIHERYALPLQPLALALLREDLPAIEFWAEWLYRLSSADLPGAGSLLRRVAQQLSLFGERDAATRMRQRAAERSNPEVSEVLSRNAVAIGRGSVMASAALMLALLALHAALTLKYQRAQRLTRERARARGQTPWRWPNLRGIRYYGFTEKLVLVLILASAYATIVLAGWVERSDAVVAYTAAGHLELPTTAALLASADGDEASLAAIAAFREGRSNQAPSPATLRAAVAERWSAAIGSAFRAPWSLLDDHQRPLGLPHWTWPAQLLLFWAFALWHLLWLPIPRPRYALNAPRPLTYQLAALLIPGAGQADELYGILMVIPWAIFGIDALLQLSGGVSPLGIPLQAAGVVLAVIYALNVLAWAIEFGAVRRRMQAFMLAEPELAREYGLVPPATPIATLTAPQ
jgi:hypothetical protein